MSHGHAEPPEKVFDELMAEVMTTAERFGHREHVHLTWLAVRRFGTSDAIRLVSDGIQRTARYAGAPQKYHATVSRAWVELIGYHAGVLPRGDTVLSGGAPDPDGPHPPRRAKRTSRRSPTATLRCSASAC